MAEEKKDAKKEEKPSGIKSEDVGLLVLGLITIFFVTIPRLTSTPSQSVVNPQTGQLEQRTEQLSVFEAYDRLFNEQIEGNTRTPSLIDQASFRAADIFKNIFYGIIIISIFFTLLLWMLVNYYGYKLKVIKEEYKKQIGAKIEKEVPIENREVPKDYVPDTNGIRNAKWEMIETYAKSGNQAELRLAIIEADIMLADILHQSGFPGATIGEMLKNADKSKLATLDHAWKAHKVRNELAHQGSNYVLGRAEAEAALDGYRRVFTELDLI